jgi:tetratricopeptide (TPR) repeat protein
VAEITCLVDETGRVRDVFVTESLPSRNLSATIVSELRRQKLPAGVSPQGTASALFAFRLVYTLQQTRKKLGTVASRLRREAASGNAGAQYILSRAMLGEVDFNKQGLDAEQLLHRAADPGGDRRAMLALSHMTRDFPAAQDPAAVVAERRGWQLKSAQAGSPAGQVFVALDSWAEQSEAGRARARHWLEQANKAKDPSAPKYLAALLVSHSTNSADWKIARDLALAATGEWHDKLDPDSWQILAAASSLLEDFPSALKAQNKAIELAARVNWPTDALERRLAAYRDSRTVKDEIVVIPAVARVVTFGESEQSE